MYQLVLNIKMMGPTIKILNMVLSMPFNFMTESNKQESISHLKKLVSVMEGMTYEGMEILEHHDIQLSLV